ncbi:MAG: hypothetical protein ACYDAZ_01930 [Thermoplasmataceae archaeon]
MNNKIRRVFSVTIILVLISTVLTVLVVNNVDQPVYYLKNDPLAATYQNYVVNSTGGHVNYTRFGYINLSSDGCTQSYRYFLIGFRLGFTVINNTTLPYLQIAPVWLYVVKVSQILAWPYNSTSISVSAISITSPQGMPPMSLQQSISSGPSNSHGSVGFDIGNLIWPFYNSLLEYPGFHNFYLNFTLTPYADLGPFKFSGNPVQMSLEWNNTIA